MYRTTCFKRHIHQKSVKYRQYGTSGYARPQNQPVGLYESVEQITKLCGHMTLVPNPRKSMNWTIIRVLLTY
jgi:hypothetical protein